MNVWNKHIGEPHFSEGSMAYSRGQQTVSGHGSEPAHSHLHTPKPALPPPVLLHTQVAGLGSSRLCHRVPWLLGLIKKKKKSCGFWGVDVNWSEKKLTFEIQWTFPCPWHVNNDLLIEAAFSKMKNNLRFMDKSVQKDPALLGAKVETMSGDS